MIVNPPDTWQNQFGTDYDVPEIITSQMDDSSWHHDACPSFTPKNMADCKAIRIVLWADHPVSEQRDCPEGKRFTVCIEDEYGFIRSLLYTDDAALAVAHVKALALLLQEAA